MEVQLQIKMNEKLFLRNPEQSELGKKIILHSIQLIHKNGFESFTFKKLADDIGTTEAGIYRYFENKHRLLIYIAAWYWSWLEYRVAVTTNNIKDPAAKLKKVIKLLATVVEDDIKTSHVNENILHQIIIAEGTKAYLTKHVSEDNKDQLFKPYKDLCAKIGEIILDCNTKSSKNITIFDSSFSFPKSVSAGRLYIKKFWKCAISIIVLASDFGYLYLGLQSRIISPILAQRSL